MGKYRIKTRLMSSNIIEIKEDGKWKPYIAPLINKDDGDLVCVEVLKFLTEHKE